jgi:hypothetical protein
MELNGSKVIDLEKSMNMFMSCYQNTGRNKAIRTATKSLKNVLKFKYLGTKVTIKITPMKKERAD